MVENAELYKKFLEKNKINNFEIQEVGDAHHSVIFRSMVSHRGQYTPIGIIFDDTIYIIIRVNFAPKALDDENAYAVSNFIMRLNHANKLLKYYLAPDTSVILDICIPTLPGHFSPELVQTLLGVAVREVEAHQSEFMKLIWQDATVESEKKDDAAKSEARMAKTETMDESVATAANDEEAEDDDVDARPEMKSEGASESKVDTASEQTEQIAETAQAEKNVKAEQAKQDEQIEQTEQTEQVTQAEAPAPKRRVTRRAAPKTTKAAKSATSARAKASATETKAEVADDEAKKEPTKTTSSKKQRTLEEMLKLATPEQLIEMTKKATPEQYKAITAEIIRRRKAKQ